MGPLLEATEGQRETTREATREATGTGGEVLEEVQEVLKKY